MAVDGTYNITVESPMGKQPGKLVFKTEGNTLTGTYEDAMGKSELQNGTVNGSNLEWVVTIKSPMGPLTANVKAAVDGDNISGDVETPFGTAPMEGKKV